MPALGESEQARLLSCIDEIRSVIGETISERRIVDTVLKNNFDCTQSLDEILNDTTAATNIASGSKKLGASSIAEKVDIEKGKWENIFYINISFNDNLKKHTICYTFNNSFILNDLLTKIYFLIFFLDNFLLHLPEILFIILKIPIKK